MSGTFISTQTIRAKNKHTCGMVNGWKAAGAKKLHGGGSQKLCHVKTDVYIEGTVTAQPCKHTFAFKNAVYKCMAHKCLCHNHQDQRALGYSELPQIN